MCGPVPATVARLTERYVADRKIHDMVEAAQQERVVGERRAHTDHDGVVQYNHPFSSGLDDSPLWDYGMPVESPDLNTYLCVQMGCFSVMAEALGMADEAGMWRRRASALVRRMIQDMWDEKAGLF